MSQPLILHIETATRVCSVALSHGDDVIALKESDRDRSHATLLTSFIRECFSEAKKTVSDLSAISISKGPGSYTGLRIGVSTVKGIAYGNTVPVIAIGTLSALAQGSLENSEIRDLLNESEENFLLCPMLDARRMEVYTAFFRPDGHIHREVSADIITQDSYSDLLHNYRVCFFGEGSDKCRKVIKHPNASFIDAIVPSARNMVLPALKAYHNKQFEDVAYFEPFYLKEFIATIPRKKVF